MRLAVHQKQVGFEQTGTNAFAIEQFIAASYQYVIEFVEGADQRTIATMIVAKARTTTKRAGQQRLAAIIKASRRHYQKYQQVEYRAHLLLKLSSSQRFLKKISYR